jgi:F-type H+-transporting ATPase subunit alpha
LEAFAQFGSDLDEATRNQLELGRRLTELLKQSQYQPVVMEKQVVSLYAVNNGYMDDVAVEKVRDFEQKLIEYLETQDKGILEAIRDTKELTEDIEAKLKTALERFKQSYS